jgi:regulator of protease activity HflC (stomatin/prohibitin superfamily)
MRIYAESYSADLDFYGFWRSLQALKHSLNENATLVLDQTHPLWADLLNYITATP